MANEKDITYPDKHSGSMLTFGDINEIKSKHNQLVSEYEKKKVDDAKEMEDFNKKIFIKI